MVNQQGDSTKRSQWQHHVESQGFCCFVTREVHHLPNGQLYQFDSRWHRKGRGGLIFDTATNELFPAQQRKLRQWELSNLSLWVSFLFTIGSLEYVVASLSPFLPMHVDRLLHASVNGFIGSMLFTIACYISLFQIINSNLITRPDMDHHASRSAIKVNKDDFDDGSNHSCNVDTDNSSAAVSPAIKSRSNYKWWAWMPHKLSFVACFTMFSGGLFFKLCYLFSIFKSLGWIEKDILINIPGLIACILYVLASYLYIVEVVHKPWGVILNSIPWWSAFTCLLGSAGFLVSGIGAFFLEGPIATNKEWGDLSFFMAGSIFFLISSVLMFPEALDQRGEVGPIEQVGLGDEAERRL